MSLAAFISSAQDYNVTFRVDMQDYAGSFTTPEVNGSFNGWCGGCNALTNTSGTIWEATILIPAGSYQFKYAVDSWADQEALVAGAGAPCFIQDGDFTNRNLDVSSDMTLDLACWNSCHACVAGGVAGCTDASSESYNAAATVEDGSCLYDVSFTVDMSQVTDAFTTPEVNGSFNGWCGGCNALSDNGDGTWSGTFTYQAGSYEFKYAADGWTIQESLVAPASCLVANFGNVNRYVSVNSDTAIGEVCYNSCSACTSDIPGCTDMGAQNYNAAATIDNGSCEYLLTVTVDMSQVTDGFTTPEINGNYNGWCGGCNPLTDNGDGTWSGTFQIPNGDLEYKFAADSWTIQEDLTGVTGCVVDFGGNWNRVLSFTEDTNVSVVCWGSCDACAAPASDVRITSVNPTTGNVTLTNLGNASQDVSSWNLCNFPAYDPISAATLVSGSTMLTAGASVEVQWADLIDADGECGLYTTGSGFSNSANIVDYVEWASTGHQRSAVAVAAGVWNTGDFVDGPAPYDFTGGAGDYGSAFWDATNPNYDVTFVMDLSNETVNALGVNIAGTFNGFDPNGGLMTNNGDGTFSYTVNAEEGSVIEYKYINGNNFIDEESVPSECGVDNGFGGFNRIHTVGSADETLATVCFGSCTACVVLADCNDVNAANYNSMASTDSECLYNTTFTIDMNDYTDPFTTLNVAGEWNGFCADCNLLSDDDSDGVWTVTLPIAAGSYSYKFQLDSWTVQENLVSGAGAPCYIMIGGFTNRFTTIEAVASNDIAEHCWESCYACNAGGTAGCTDAAANNYDAAATDEDGSCLYDITFQVDMSQVADAFTLPEVNGSFNGWCGGCNALADNGDGTWSATIEIQAGSYEFKYAADAWNIQEDLSGEASGLNSCVVENSGFYNRSLNVSGDLTLDLVCYNLCSTCPAAIPGCTDASAQNYNAAAQTEDGSCTYLLTVTVNMSNVTDPFTTPEINGAYNGWCGGCNPLTDNGDGTWTGTFTVPNGLNEYKFAADAWNIQEDLAGVTGCTVTDGTFTNRIVDVTGDTVVDVVCWGSCDDCAAEGCTDPLYTEFDPYADTDDGSCLTLVVEGCAYADADNYDAAANTDDGSCTFTLGTACPGDFNNDDAITASDLTGFLSVYGGTCD